MDTQYQPLITILLHSLSDVVYVIMNVLGACGTKWHNNDVEPVDDAARVFCTYRIIMIP